MEEKNSNNNLEFSDIVGKFNSILKEKNINLGEVLGDDDKGSPLDFDFDIDTILKFKNIYKRINSKNSSRNQFFRSLKPFLRESRKEKLEEYIKISNLLGVINLMNEINSDKKGSTEI